MKATLSATLFLIAVAAGIWMDNQKEMNARHARALESALKYSETVFSSSK